MLWDLANRSNSRVRPSRDRALTRSGLRLAEIASSELPLAGFRGGGASRSLLLPAGFSIAYFFVVPSGAECCVVCAVVGCLVVVLLVVCVVRTVL